MPEQDCGSRRHPGVGRRVHGPAAVTIAGPMLLWIFGGALSAQGETPVVADPSAGLLDRAWVDSADSGRNELPSTPRWPSSASSAVRDSQQPSQQPQEPKRWSSFLPLLKEEALARGYQLPLPFGAGATFTILTGRDIEVTDLRVGVDGAEPSSVSRFVDLGSESNVFNANLKLDAWILPFLNVYTLFGYVYNRSETNVHVTLPAPGGTTEFDMDVNTELDGFVGGGGLTLAAGYDDFFMVIDSNYSQTDIGFDDSFRAITASMRAGFQTMLGEKHCQVWTGGAYWDTENVAKGSKDIPGVGHVEFEADQGPVYPWLIDFGGNIRIARGCELFADLAFDLHGGAIVTVGPVWRF